jgi:CheY-like chemotaxis protein
MENATLSEPLAIELTRQLGAIITSLIWPIAVIIVLIRFSPAITAGLSRFTKFIFKGAGIEISGEVQQQILANLTAAEIQKGAEEKGGAETTKSINVLQTGLVQKALTNAQMPAASNRLRSATVLWVDDEPEGNLLEMDSLRKLGLNIDTAVSSDQAEGFLKRRLYDLIITDLRRGADDDAGLDLIKTILQRIPEQKILVYTAFTSPKKRNAALAAGAKGVTNSPSELFGLVVSTLQ